MRIAIIVPSLANKGPVIVARDICEYLVRLGHACKVFYFDEKEKKDCIEFPCDSQKISFYKRIDFDSFDVVHVHCLRPALYVACNKMFIKRAECVVTLHQPITKAAYTNSGYNSGVATMVSIVSKVVYNRFDCCVVLSEIQRRLAKDLIGKRLEVINNGRDVCSAEVCVKDNVAMIKSLANSYKIVGTASVVNKRKGLDQMVRALVKLKDFAFVCVGDGPELPNLKQMAHELNVAERCLWLGYQADAVNYYKHFDIFVMCTHSEGYPLALIEAAGNNSACVLSDIEILKQIIPDDSACFYHLDDVDSLATQIECAYKDKEVLSGNLFAFYKQHLTADIMGQRYLDLFKTLVKG